MTLEKARGRMSHFYDAEALLADLKALIEAGGHSRDPRLEGGPSRCGLSPLGVRPLSSLREVSREYCVSFRPEMPRMFGGLGRDGGMAEYMIVPDSRFLLRLGKLDPKAAAPLTDAAMTP